MNKILAVFLIALLGVAWAEDSRPNVIVIMADDLGYNDVGFHGSKYVKTPNLDKLAAAGTIFSDAHTAASVCSPSRAGFITGRYQQRFGHEANCPPHGQGMDVNEYTMGQAFQSIGYGTVLIGKWHLGNLEKHYPTNRGFDHFLGLREGSRSFYHNKKDDKKNNPKRIERNGEIVKFDKHLTTVFTDEAIDYINKADKPYFMFLSHTAPHGPLQADKDDLKRANGNPYHALIEDMDDHIGRVIEALKKNGQYENTMIWFLSDNGGTVKQASNYPLNGKKGIKFEGGQRVPFTLTWPAKLPAGQKFDGLTSAMDIFATSFKAAGGSKLPKPLDGVDLLPYVKGEKKGNPHEIIFWRKLEGAAVRLGYWKLIRTEGLPLMLYNLEDDLSERKNLAKSNPEKAQELLKRLEAWEKKLVESWWGEPGWHKQRKKDYIRFRDAKDFIKL